MNLQIDFVMFSFDLSTTDVQFIRFPLQRATLPNTYFFLTGWLAKGLTYKPEVLDQLQLTTFVLYSHSVKFIQLTIFLLSQ